MTVATLETLSALIVQWRERRHPRLAELIDVIDGELGVHCTELTVSRSRASAEAWAEVETKRALRDFKRLARAIRAGTLTDVVAHVRALAAWDDPRLVDALFALLDDPPATGTRGQPLVDAVVGALRATGDARVAPRARALATRYTEIDESDAGLRTIAALDALAARMEAIVVADLPEPLVAQCAALEAALGPDAFARQRAASRSAADRRVLEALLALVYASPDDDEPRLVYADALLERGDPHGELIMLQIARARGDRTPVSEAREKELLTDGNKRAWGAPFSSVGWGYLVRGFPEEVSTSQPISRQLAQHPAWSLVTTLSGPAPAALRGLMQQPHLRRVRRLTWMTPAQVAALDDDARARITDLQLHATRITDEALLRGFTGLEKLELHAGAPVPERLLADLPALRELKLSAKLPRGASVQPALVVPASVEALAVCVESGTYILAAPPLERLRSLTLGGYMSYGRINGVSALLASAPYLEKLQIDVAGDLPHGGALQRLTSLYIGGFGKLQAKQLSALAALKTLDAASCSIEPGALAPLTQLTTLRIATHPDVPFSLDEIPNAPLLKIDVGVPDELAELARLVARMPLANELYVAASFGRDGSPPLSTASAIASILEGSPAAYLGIAGEYITRKDGSVRISARHSGAVVKEILRGLSTPATVDVIGDESKRAAIEAELAVAS